MKVATHVPRISHLKGLTFGKKISRNSDRCGLSWRQGGSEKQRVLLLGNWHAQTAVVDMFLMDMWFEVIHFEELVAYAPWMQQMLGSAGLPG